MRIEHKVIQSTLYIAISGELDESTAAVARSMLDNIFQASNSKRVILLLSGLTFMDSTGIGVLLGRYKKLKMRDITIYISEPSRQVDKILSISGIYDIMPKI